MPRETDRLAETVLHAYAELEVASSARADTAYDARGVYEALENHRVHSSPRVLVPPRKDAQLATTSATTRQKHPRHVGFAWEHKTKGTS